MEGKGVTFQMHCKVTRRACQAGEKELLPWARARYHLIQDPAQTCVVEDSRGGLAAAYLGGFVVNPVVHQYRIGRWSKSHKPDSLR